MPGQKDELDECLDVKALSDNPHTLSQIKHEGNEFRGGCCVISFSWGATEEGTVGGGLSEGDIIVGMPHWSVLCVWVVSVQDIKWGFKEN